jgi:hypothetical protein
MLQLPNKNKNSFDNFMTTHNLDLLQIVVYLNANYDKYFENNESNAIFTALKFYTEIVAQLVER